MSLHAFQQQFHAALWHDAPTALSAQPGFAVYRNTVMKGCIDALVANYPAVVSLVGEDCVRAAAAVHVRAAPPTQPMLLQYGAGFADFLAHFPPVAAWPWLPAVARLDRHWTEAHVAANAPCADAALLATCAPDVLGARCLQPHPAARWLWCGEAPALSLWQINRGERPLPAAGLSSLPWHGEGALTTRPFDTVRVSALPAAGCVLLDACAQGATLAAAVTAALAVAPTLDIAALFAQLLTMGAFAASDPAA
jgi:hypothetical protein